MNEAEDKQIFVKRLQDYWMMKGMTAMKIPQIGGRELDFYRLYKAVCKRGGAQAVSNNKMWKEIVNEFGLPATCTSASFTLRNHYTRFLLGFEQKHFFGKEDDSELPELMAGRQRAKKTKTNPDNSDDEGDEESVNETSQHEEQRSQQSQQQQQQQQIQQPIIHKPPKNYYQVNQPQQINVQQSQLGQILTQQYSKMDKKEELYYIKRNKMYPQAADIKRIILAFESRMQDEMAFALNSLLLYSVNVHAPFQLENYSNLLENITIYLEESIRNIPNLSKVLQIKEIVQRPVMQNEIESFGAPETTQLIRSLNILENYNFPVCDIIMFNQKHLKYEISPLKLLQKRRHSNIDKMYDIIGECYLLEQTRTIFLILRNLCLSKSNEIQISKNERLCQMIIQLFLLNCDQEISHHVLDIIVNIAKHLQLQNVPDYKKFSQRIFDILQSDNNEELEAGVDAMRNLISVSENEALIENMLPMYIDSMTRLLLYSHGDIREGVLEFLCFLSDLRMSTRVTLAQQPKLIMRLIGLLGSGVGKHNEKIAKLAALTLNNISIAPASRPHLQPFEKDLFIVAATDESVSKWLGNILSELDTYDLEEIE